MDENENENAPFKRSFTDPFNKFKSCMPMVLVLLLSLIHKRLVSVRINSIH